MLFPQLRAVQEKGMAYERGRMKLWPSLMPLHPMLWLFWIWFHPSERADKAEEVTLSRLQQNPKGFAQALKAINHSLQQDCSFYTSWQSPWPGASFVGGLSWPVMHERHERLMRESKTGTTKP